jgi:drug/metabolite transporter (DMT)-like permease
MQMDRTRRDGILLILLAVSGLSFFPIFTHFMSDNGLESQDIATWRFLVSAPLLWLIVLMRGGRASGEPLPRWSLLAVGTLLAVEALTGIRGLQLIPAGVFVLLFYSNPAMVAVINLVRGERLGKTVWLALVMTTIGIALTLPDLSAGLAQTQNAEGAALAIFSAFVIALYLVLLNHFLRGTNDSSRATAYTTTGALLPLLGLMLVRPLTIPSNPTTWALVLGFALVSTVFPMIAFTAGIQKLGASRAAIVSTVEPLLTLIWSFLLLGEKLLPIQIVGGALIFISVILIQLRSANPDSMAEGEAKPNTEPSVVA